MTINAASKGNGVMVAAATGTMAEIKFFVCYLKRVGKTRHLLKRKEKQSSKVVVDDIHQIRM